MEATGRKGLVVKADLGIVSDVRQMIESGIQYFGKLDILVNNTGLEKNTDFWDVTEENYDNVLNVNLKGVFFATQALVQPLRKTKRSGKIINISSAHEELPFPHFTSYCASKGGVKMMMRNLAVELGSLGITINNVAPGAIETPINKSLMEPEKLSAVLSNIPLGRLGQPNDCRRYDCFFGFARGRLCYRFNLLCRWWIALELPRTVNCCLYCSVRKNITEETYSYENLCLRYHVCQVRASTF